MLAMPTPPQPSVRTPGGVPACLAALVIAGASVGAANAQADGVQRLAWLAGCWASSAGERQVEEHWTAPRAGSMLGMSRTVRGDRLVEYEFVILRERGAQLAYEVSPSGRPSTVFLSTTIDARSVVFENLQHDFPQRVAYERSGDELQAWIEGPGKTAGSTPRRIAFAYRRVPCAAN
jgi:hypothetical protein